MLEARPSRSTYVAFQHFRVDEMKYKCVWLVFRWAMFTYVWWQVTLCDPIWQM